MPQNATSWEWTETRLEAAQLVAEDRLSDLEIATQVGVDRRTVIRWKEKPEFAAKVQERRLQFDAAILQRGIASRTRRVEALDSRWRKMHQVITERAADPAMQAVPGGATGLLCHDVKVVGGGDNAERVDVYETDTALLKSILDHEKQAAQELGQWVEKMAPTTPDGVSSYDGLTDTAALQALHALYARLGAGTGTPSADRPGPPP